MYINEVEKAKRIVQLREATAKVYSVADCKQALEKNEWDTERAKVALQPADISAILSDSYLLYGQRFPIVDVNCEPGIKTESFISEDGKTYEAFVIPNCTKVPDHTIILNKLTVKEIDDATKKEILLSRDPWGVIDTYDDWDTERVKPALQPADGYLLCKQQLNVPIVDVNCEPGIKVDWDWIASNIEFKSGGESVTLIGCSKYWK
jgi:hypothetical protein